MLFLIYLIVPPGNLRHSLCVLLTALDTDSTINQYDTLDSVLMQSEVESPGLIVFDAVILGDDPTGRMKQMQQQWPQARVVALVNNKKQVEGLQSADRIVITGGMAAARLRIILNDLLCDLRDGTQV